MKPVFDVYLKKAGPQDSGAHAALYLPATPYEVQDALDRLRLGENSVILWEITEYPQFEELEPFLDGNGSFFELNALAQRLSELDEARSAIFAGLLKMEKSEGPLPLLRLIDLAYSTECCHILLDTLNDSQLGRIFAENNHIPGVEHLPSDVFEMLDFEQIGRRTRVSDKGVFVARSMDHPGGYVARHAPLLEVSKTLDLTPKVPDYTMLLEVFHDSSAVQLKLPASDQDLDALPQSLDEPDWLDLSWRCLDCKVPSLMDAVSEARDIHAVNDFAGMLARLNGKALASYKALLEASDCRDLLHAGSLAGQTRRYTFSPQVSSPVELAKEELSVLLCKPEAEMVLPHVDLQKYGEELIKQCGGKLTGYGLIERTDRRPVQSPSQEQMEGGMALG